jgi:hypothetical protein
MLFTLPIFTNLGRWAYSALRPSWIRLTGIHELPLACVSLLPRDANIFREATSVNLRAKFVIGRAVMTIAIHCLIAGTAFGQQTVQLH